VPQATARHWLTVLEAGYVVLQLPPFFADIRKRLVKSPKLYFHDVGLAGHLLGIENVGQMAAHPARGPLFENAVVVEALKHRFNTGRRSNLSFFRDADGVECDLLYENGNGVGVTETTLLRERVPIFVTPLNQVSRPQAARYALPNTTTLTITATPIHTAPHAVVESGVISASIAASDCRCGRSSTSLLMSRIA